MESLDESFRVLLLFGEEGESVFKDFFSGTTGIVKQVPPVLLPHFFLISATRLFPLPFFSVSSDGESHSLGGAQSCFVQSRRVPT